MVHDTSCKFLIVWYLVTNLVKLATKVKLVKKTFLGCILVKIVKGKIIINLCEKVFYQKKNYYLKQNSEKCFFKITIKKKNIY